MKTCTVCHGTEVATNAALDKAGWLNIIRQMNAIGAKVKKDDADTISGYLAKNFGSRGTKVNVNKAGAKEIEDGLHLTSKEAEALAQYRKEHGDFKDWHDLLKIPGVDGAKIQAAKDQIAFE